MEKVIKAIGTYISGAAFAILLCAALAFYQVFVGMMVFSPAGEGIWGRLVTDFRVWCFGYDPRSGSMRWTAAWVMMSEPVLLQAVVLYFWRRQIAALWRLRPAAVMPPLTGGLAIALAAGFGLLGLATRGAAETPESPPFPGERIRTALAAPDFSLGDQYGREVSLEAKRGRVVLITAVYTLCGTTCPLILQQVKESWEALESSVRDDLSMVAISLDPEHDTAEKRANLAEAWGLDKEAFHFLGGAPGEVHRVLNELQVARSRNAEGGIDHANLFYLIDRSGRIAYRLGLSERHQAWLPAALRSLLEEP
jgi:protein SCO1